MRRNTQTPSSWLSASIVHSTHQPTSTVLAIKNQLECPVKLMCRACHSIPYVYPKEFEFEGDVNFPPKDYFITQGLDRVAFPKYGNRPFRGYALCLCFVPLILWAHPLAPHRYRRSQNGAARLDP
jgi:hypothetical protein